MVSGPKGTSHHRFVDLVELLDPGDLLVVNESRTVPANVPAVGSFGPFRISLSTPYGGGVWLAEPRWAFDRPGPVPLAEGDRLQVAGLPARVVAVYPGIARLLFLKVDGPLARRRDAVGSPIRYAYVPEPFPLTDYQTVFARVPGSAEMPSAGRPFSRRLVNRLVERGVGFASVVLHAGVSSISAEDSPVGALPIFPEPFSVPASTVRAIDRARSRGRRVIAVGTTVVRALETSASDGQLRPSDGFTQLFVRPGMGPPVADGLISGFHDVGTTHLSLLEAFVGRARLDEAYRTAADAAYLWHEFGDSHLLLRN